MTMRGKSKISKRNGKAKSRLFVMLLSITAITFTVAAKGNQPKIVGYTYDTGSTLWDIAKEHCPDDMDVRDVIREIRKVNGIEGSVIYQNWLYKVPVYETESDYLDMNTIIGYETSDDGVLLLTNDGNGYFIEK